MPDFPTRTHAAGDLAPTQGDPEIWILEDDSSMRTELLQLFAAKGYRSRVHGSLDDLLLAGNPPTPACLMLGNELADGLTGVQVLEELRRLKVVIPTVILARQWNVQTVVRAMRAGADGFLTKPVDPTELLRGVEHALKQSDSAQRRGKSSSDARARVASLNSREVEVVRLVLSGLMNKEIASHMNLAVITVKVYRARAMKKLGAGHPAELMRIASLGGIDFDPDARRHA